MVGHDVYFQAGRNATILVGDDVSINTGCHIIASERISIGHNVAIGEYVSIRDQEHKHDPATGVRGQGFDHAPVDIESNCWIGRGVYIGPGTKIGKGTIVAANSVLRGEYPPSSLVAGTPAVVKKSLRSREFSAE